MVSSHEKGYQDPDVLRELYHSEGKTQREIGDRFDVSKSTIVRWMGKLDIDTRDPGGGDPDAPWKDEDRLRRMYHDERMYLAEMADELGVDESTLRHWMDKFGIERIPMGPKVSPVYLKTDHRGYECIRHRHRGEEYIVPLHRLLAVAEFGFGAVCDNDVHHKNGLSWGNWPGNAEPMDHKGHARHHAMETEFWKYRDDAEVPNHG